MREYNFSLAYCEKRQEIKIDNRLDMGLMNFIDLCKNCIKVYRNSIHLFTTINFNGVFHF